MAANHDARFKALLRVDSILRDFFRRFLPDVAAYMDFAHLEFVDKERTTFEGRRRTGDLLVKTRYRNDPAAFLIHLEHQAQPDSLLPQRMLEYFVLDWRDFELPVYPVLVLSHAAGAQSFPVPITVGFPDRRVLEFDFPVINLTAMDANAHANVPNTAALALSSVMQIARTERIALGVKMVCSLDRMPVGALAREVVTGFFFSNQRLSQSETLKFREELSKIKPVSRRERIMQWTNPWIETGMQLGRTEGMQLGRTKGMQEGRRQEAADLVLRQLRRRLGSVSAEEEEAVQSLPIRRLESLGEALLDFKRAADLSAWLRRHSCRRRRAR